MAAVDVLGITTSGLGWWISGAFHGSGLSRLEGAMLNTLWFGGDILLSSSEDVGEEQQEDAALLLREKSNGCSAGGSRFSSWISMGPPL